MKIETAVVAENILMGDLVEKKFGIIENEKMYRILSSKIYTNKIAAPIRELCCNAYDAHVEAGKKDVPFRVHVPTFDESYFEVQDFGPGLNANEIENLYTSYGYSSKENSNNMIGCLGLGSKSPFAYTESFSILSRKGGIQYYYNCIMDNGVPKLVKFDEFPSNEPSGLTIRFEVKNGDVRNFVDECKSILRFFQPVPVFNIENFDLPSYPEFEHRICIKRGFYFSNNRMFDFGVLMGNVLYHFNPESVLNHPACNESKKIKKLFSYAYGLIIQAEIGDVEISVSREAVELKEKTIKFIQNRILNYFENVKKAFFEKEYPNQLEFLIEYKKFIERNKFLPETDFNSQVEKFKIPFEGKMEYLMVFKNWRNDYERRLCSCENEFTFEPDNIRGYITFVYNEKKLLSTSKINNQVMDPRYLFIIFQSKEFFEALRKQNIQVHDISEFRTVPQITERKKFFSGLYFKNLKTGNYSKVPVETLENKSQIFYVLFDKKNNKILDSEFERNQTRLKLESSFCYKPVFYLTESKLKEIKDDSRFVNFVDYINANYGVESEIFKKLRNNFLLEKISALNKENLELKFDVSKFPVEFRELLTIKRVYISDDFARYCSWDFKAEEELVKRFYTYIINKFPILKLYFYDNSSSSSYRDMRNLLNKELNQYIKEIESKE